MKRLVLLCGASLLATVGFSQQVSGERKAIVKPVENGETVQPEMVKDSLAVLHSMARDAETVTAPVSKENEPNAGKEPVKVTTLSSARKPD